MFDRAHDYCVRFFHEAKGKLSTYLGLLIASAGEMRENWRSVDDAIKAHPSLLWWSHQVFLFLGFLVIYARIRRAMKGQ